MEPPPATEHAKALKREKAAQKSRLMAEIYSANSRAAAATRRVDESDAAKERDARQLERAHSQLQLSNAENVKLLRELRKLREEHDGMWQRLHSRLTPARSKSPTPASPAPVTPVTVKTVKLAAACAETALRAFEKMKLDVGVASERASVPSRKFDGDGGAKTSHVGWDFRVVGHVSATPAGRGGADDLDGVERIARGIARADSQLPRLLVASPIFAKARRQVALDVVAAVQARWSPRLAVHLWDRRGLSRSQYETMRHLLSFEYERERDKFAPLVVLRGDGVVQDVHFPRLPSRQKRELEYEGLAARTGVVANATTGSAQRDPVRACGVLYTQFKAAMRDNFSAARPARPTFLLDGTGSALGRGITHCELGSADFAGECKQSRESLAPLALAECHDDTAPINEQG